jgi:hypothetical protein
LAHSVMRIKGAVALPISTAMMGIFGYILGDKRIPSTRELPLGDFHDNGPNHCEP